MRIAVIGAGGIGGFVAAMLARAGNTVSVVARGAHLAAIRANGLHVSSTHFGEIHVTLQASEDLRAMPPVEMIVLCTKAHQTHALLEQFVNGPSCKADILTLQNGLPFWYFPDRPVRAVDPDGALRAQLPDTRLIGGVVHASGTLLEPGHVRHEGHFRYPIGESHGAVSERVRRLAACFRDAGLQAEPENEIRVATWRKLFGNVALNPVSALTGATVHAMVQDAHTSVLLQEIILEARAVAQASGIDVAETVEARMAHIQSVADVKTSMLQDLEAGRELELEPIVGATLELASIFSVPVPRIAALYALTKLRAESRPICS